MGVDGALEERAEVRLETNHAGAHELVVAQEGAAPRVLVNGLPAAGGRIEAGRLRVDGYTVIRLEGARGSRLRRVELRPVP